MAESYLQDAWDHLDNGEVSLAGDFFTQAAYQAFAHDAISEGRDQQVAYGLDGVLRAALCYRRAGSIDRCANRCRQGILVTEDLQANVIEDPRRIAVLQEFVADFHALGEFDGTDAAYESALEQLQAVDLEYTISFHSVPISDSIIGFTQYIVQFAEEEPDEDLELIYDFAGRVAYKREHMGDIVASLGE